MKKRNGTMIAGTAHTALWGIVLTVCMIGRILFSKPEAKIMKKCERRKQKANKVVFSVIFAIILLTQLSSCDGRTLSSYFNLYKYSADYESYASDFNKVKDYVVKTHSGEDEKWFFVSNAGETGITLYDPDVDLYINLPSDVKKSLEVINKYGFPNKDSNLDTIVIFDGRVSFFIEINNYAIVYSPSGKPTYLFSPDESCDILVKTVGDGWYHVIVDPK